MAHSHKQRVSTVGLSPISSQAERELKLAIDDDFRLPRLPGTPLPRRLLISTYYDTASYDLARARIALRRRIERGKHSWQLKIPLGGDRQEIEEAHAQADPPAALRDLLILHLGDRNVRPVVTLRVWRSSFVVRQGGAPVAELAIDHVAVVKNGSVIQRFRELEIEQRQGDESFLYSLEKDMRKAGASDHDGRLKLFRTLSLALPTPPMQPDAEAPASEHLKSALAQHVGWLLAHDPGTRLGAESESLHQMRVATRRLRAVLRMCRPILLPSWAMPLQQEVKWLSEILGPVRDLDVQISYFVEESTVSDVRDRATLGGFISQLRSQRDAAQKVMLGELISARYFDLIRRLRQAAEAPSFVESSLKIDQLAKREFKKLRKAIKRIGLSPSNAALHKVRIKTKRARYAVDLARNSLGKPAVRFIKSARAVQDLLGIHQDTIEAERHVRQFLQYTTGVRGAFLAGRMVERQRSRRDAARNEMKPLFKMLLKRGRKAWR